MPAPLLGRIQNALPKGMVAVRADGRVVLPLGLMLEARPSALSVELRPRPERPGQRFRWEVRLLDSAGNPVPIRKGWRFTVSIGAVERVKVRVPAELSESGEEAVREASFRHPTGSREFTANADCLSLAVEDRIPPFRPRSRSSGHTSRVTP